MKTTTTAIRTGETKTSDVSVADQVSKVTLGVVSLATCGIGLWALAGIVGGIVASDGPGGLIANWVSAVFG